jgi:hypothetical protein
MNKKIIIIIILIIVIITAVSAVLLLNKKAQSNVDKFNVIALRQQFLTVGDNDETKNKINSINPGLPINYKRNGKTFLPAEFRVVFKKDGKIYPSDLILTRSSSAYSYPTTLALLETPIILNEGESINLQFKGIFEVNDNPSENLRTDINSPNQYEWLDIYIPLITTGVPINWIAFTMDDVVY